MERSAGSSQKGSHLLHGETAIFVCIHSLVNARMSSLKLIKRKAPFFKVQLPIVKQRKFELPADLGRVRHIQKELNSAVPWV